jgi:hypothetical protein
VRGRDIAHKESGWGEGCVRGHFILLEQEWGRYMDMFSLGDFIHSRKDVQVEEFMFGSIGGDFIKRLDKDFFTWRFLPRLEHWIIDVVIYGSWGGVVDYWHGCPGEFEEGIMGRGGHVK